MVAQLSERGAHVALGDGDLVLVASALGRGGALASLPVGAPSTAESEVHTARGPDVTEWWRATPGGLEHGLTVARRPGGTGELVALLDVAGLEPRTRGARSLELLDASGRRVATYSDLVAYDAAGAELPARMEVRGAAVALVVDDGGARYPIVIDPLLVAVEEASLTATGAAGGDAFGSAVALSGDGLRAIVGAPFDDTPTGGTDAGSARVFFWDGTAWNVEAVLQASGAALGDAFGVSVSLDATGGRALVGAYGEDTAGGFEAGSARVFVRSGSAWTEEARLVASDGLDGDFLGSAVALSDDGARAIVGAYGDDVGALVDAGSARIFTRTGSAWTEQATLLVAGAGASDGAGGSVALSGDGLRAIVGASGDDTAAGADAGSATVFSFGGASWTREATLSASGGAAGDALGVAVALSRDGSRALVGAYLDDGTLADAGSARIYLRSGTTWAEEAALVASDAGAQDLLGWSVSLSADGARALLGAYWDDTPGARDAGSARVFERTGTVWSEAVTLVAAGGLDDDWLGAGVALPSDGSRALVGRNGDDIGGGTDAGSALVFRLRPADAAGAACTTSATCLSGFCVDGVCCESACGGGAMDCQACASALTGGASGTCAPLTGAIAAAVLCRPSVGGCDDAEVCTATSTTCPADAVLPAATICRASMGACDLAEACDGTSTACPVEARMPAGTECRASAGACDAAEACDGTSAACPADVRVPSGVVCRGRSGDCDLEEQCDGASALCPSDGFRASGDVCRVSIGFCDVEDTCSGTSGACPDVLRPAGTECAPSSGAECDAPDLCAGTSADCIETFLSGVACRAGAGTCDSAEVCLGDGPTCPPDAVVASGTPCRTSTDPVCDAEETCDGVSTACPADVTSCRPGVDAGPRDGGAPDAAAPPVAVTGSCRALPGHAGTPSALVAVALVVALALRRRRAPA